MFPIDSTIMDFDQKMLDQFDDLHHFDWKLRDILPKVLVAGESAGVLTAEGQNYWILPELYSPVFLCVLPRVMREPEW